MCEPEKSLLSLSHMRHLLLSKCIQCLNIDEIIIAITQSSLLAKRTVTFSFLSQDYFNNISVDIWCLILIMSKCLQPIDTITYTDFELCVCVYERERGVGVGGGALEERTHIALSYWWSVLPSGQSPIFHASPPTRSTNSTVPATQLIQYWREFSVCWIHIQNMADTLSLPHTRVI